MMSSRRRIKKPLGRINNRIKDNFKQYLSNDLAEGSWPIDLMGYFATGQGWDTFLSKCIRLTGDKREQTSSGIQLQEQVAKKLISKLRNTYQGLEIIRSKFPLFGFMRDAPGGKKTPKSYLWQGEADAIAIYKGKYIIVDFKVVDDFLTYTQNKTDLCGKHLHQCLIYAQLLKLHMNLDYLPPTLIVVIEGKYGRLMYPPLFEDYPEECKEKLNEFEWSKEMFPEKPPLRLVFDPKLFLGTSVGPINPDKKLKDIFRRDATVKNLLDALGYGSLETIKLE